MSDYDLAVFTGLTEAQYEDLMRIWRREPFVMNGARRRAMSDLVDERQELTGAGVLLINRWVFERDEALKKRRVLFTQDRAGVARMARTMGYKWVTSAHCGVLMIMAERYEVSAPWIVNVYGLSVLEKLLIEECCVAAWEAGRFSRYKLGERGWHVLRPCIGNYWQLGNLTVTSGGTRK